MFITSLYPFHGAVVITAKKHRVDVTSPLVYLHYPSQRGCCRCRKGRSVYDRAWWPEVVLQHHMTWTCDAHVHKSNHKVEHADPQHHMTHSYLHLCFDILGHCQRITMETTATQQYPFRAASSSYRIHDQKCVWWCVHITKFAVVYVLIPNRTHTPQI